MSKKSVERTSSIIRKVPKVIAAFFYGPNLELIGNRIAEAVENGPSKSIFAITLTNEVLKGQELYSEADRKIIQIYTGVEKCTKLFEANEKNLKTLLQDDVMKFWNESCQSGELHQDEDGTGEPVPEIEEIVPRRIKDSDMRIFFNEIQNVQAQLKFCDFYIVLFGKIDSETLVDVMVSGIPLESIICFVQCQESEIPYKFPRLREDIEFWKTSPKSKNIGIFVEPWIPILDYLDVKYTSDLYDQFIWYLYDIEMLRQQFFNYQTEFYEINDEITPEEEQSWAKLEDLVSTKATSDETAVGVYLDNFFYAIEGQALRRRRYSCLHLRPFIENDFGRIVVEESNKLVISAIATQMNMVSYWRVADILVNALKTTPAREYTVNTDVKLTRFYELLSWEAFAQRLESQQFLYDKCNRYDITEKCWIYVLQRTLNKIVEKKRVYHLPTKLCYRDYTLNVAPDLVSHLRSYNERMEAAELNRLEEQDEDVAQWSEVWTLSEYRYEFHDPDQNNPQFLNVLEEAEKPKYFGLTFDDTLQQLTVIDRIYRFDSGSVRCSIEHWENKENDMTIEMRFHDCVVYVHRWPDFPSKFARVRIMNKNSMSCNIEMSRQSSMISIQWPNDCQIQYHNDNGVQAVEQRYHWKRMVEVKRLHTEEGLVMCYLNSNTIEVLTPNGVIYMLYEIDYIDTDDNDSDLKYYRPICGISIEQELEFVKRLSAYGIECEHFDVTRSDGRKLRVLCGTIIEEKAHYLVYEWTDHGLNECYAERDDGVRMVWSMEGLKCMYPCGTVITTTANDEYVDVSFGCVDTSMETILRKMNPSLVEKVSQKVKRVETYVTYKVKYLMQHKNYASVSFCGGYEMSIHNPDKMKLVLKHNSLVIVNIGKTLDFRITPGICNISSGEAIPKNKFIYSRLNLMQDATEVLTFRSGNAFLSIDSKGTMLLKDLMDASYKESTYFLAKQYKFAMAFLTKETYNEITTNLKEQTLLYDSPKKAVLFSPIYPIDVQFSMPMSEFEESCFGKFSTGCEMSHNLCTDNIQRVLSVRTIHKLDSIPEDFCSLVQNLFFIEKTLGTHIADALEHFLVKKVKSKYSPQWKKKIEQVKEEFAFNTERMAVYNAMLRKKVFPKYREYVACEGDLKKLDVNVIIPRLAKK